MGWVCLAAFAAALAASFVFVPASIWASRQFGAMDRPDARKVHRFPVPRWGGLGIALSVFAAFALVSQVFPAMKDLLAYRHRVMSGGEVVGMLSISRQVQGIFFGSLFVLGLGMWDDRFKVPAGVKLPLQIIAAYIAMDFGLRLSGISHPWRGHYIAFPLIASQVITVAWLTGFMNTVNLADGLDGLAAGISAIAAATFLAVALLQSQTGVVFFSKQLNLASVLSAAVCGASLGFLWFNFHPARVFMGDGGALFLGFMLASVTVIGTLKTAAFISFVIPILVVALPVLDVAFSILRRLRSGRDVFRPDRDHLHHRLLRHGWSQREVVLGIYVITLVLSGAAVVLTALKGRVG